MELTHGNFMVTGAVYLEGFDQRRGAAPFLYFSGSGKNFDPVPALISASAFACQNFC
jgi:hypothetical protein